MQQNEIKVSVQQLIQMFEAEKRKLLEIESQLSGLYAAINEANIAATAIKELGSVKEPIYFSIGAGVFAKASVEDASEMLFTLPSGVVINSKAEDILKKLDERKAAMQKDAEALQKELNATAQNVNNLDALIGRIAKAQQEALHK